MTAIPWPATGIQPAVGWRVRLDGADCPVQATPVAVLAGCTANAPVQVEVFCPGTAASATIRPLRLGLVAHGEGGLLRFTAPAGAQLEVEIPGQPTLTLFIDLPDEDLPDRNDPRVRWFAPGVHDVGRLRLQAGETLYLEAGAVLRGALHAVDADHLTVRGRGIIDGRHIPHMAHRLLMFERCAHLRIDGITVLGSPSWTLVLGGCREVTINRFRCIGWVVCSDGIDIVGCRQVRVTGCYLRCNDDCVAIKSVDYPEDQERTWAGDVEDVVVASCIMHNDHAGNAIEIGFETRCERIVDVTFRDIDVVAAHGEGGVFTIHAGDRAVIERIRYDDIRVEHYYDKLVDFRILASRYSRDAERGSIRDVVLRRIRAVANIYNCVSLIGGYDATHRVSGVGFVDVQLDGVPVLDGAGLHLFTSHAEGIVFSAGPAD